MQIYESHSLKALNTELDNVKRLKVLVNEMKKPDNFTYVDVLNLHQHLEALENHLRDKIKEKSDET